MAEENEVQIILTAVDNASKVIKDVNSALGGQTNTGTLPNGWVDPYANAAKEMDEMADAFNAAQNPIKKTGEEMVKTAKQTDFLSIAIKGVGVVSPQAAAQLNRLRGIGTGIGTTFTESGLSIGTFAVAAGTAAAAIGAVFLAIKSSNAFIEWAGDIKNVNEVTQDQIRTLVEYEAAVKHIDEVHRDSITLWRWLGEEATKARTAYILWDASLSETKTGGRGYAAAQQIEAIGMAADRTKDDIVVLTDEMKKLNSRANEVNYVIGYTKERFGEMAVAAIIAKAASDGIFTQQEIDYIYGMANALNVQNKEMIAAGIAAWGFQSTMLAIMDMPEEIRKKFILNIEIYGMAAAQAAYQGMGQNLPQITQDQYTQPTTTTNPKITKMMAGGGRARAGEWAMVGDAPGGYVTPYTEYVHADRGGGFTVYNKSQMAGKSAPPMAGGGMIMPPSEEVNLSDRTIEKIADAFAYKLAPFL